MKVRSATVLISAFNTLTAKPHGVDGRVTCSSARAHGVDIVNPMGLHIWSDRDMPTICPPRL